jgi:hypothetical protein
MDSKRIGVGYSVLIVAIYYALVVVLRLAGLGWDPSSFIVAGDQYTDPSQVTIPVMADSPGYDGQFYYRLALNPFTSKQVEFGITMDHPPYRHQRILYPLLVWLLSVGKHGWVPIWMIVLNYLFLIALTYLGTTYASSLGRPAILGIAFALYPGFVLSLLRDLTEVLEVCLLVLGLVLINRERYNWATVFVSLAVLTRETAILLPVGFMLAYIWSREIPKRVFVVPILVYCVWQLILFFNWGQFPLLAGGGNIATPLAGFLSLILTTDNLRYKIELLFLVSFAVLVILSIKRSEVHLGVKLAWGLYLALAIFLSKYVWVEDWAFLRVLSEFYTLAIFIMFGVRRTEPMLMSPRNPRTRAEDGKL